MAPIGYPTNMMVYRLGGYRFTDFLRVGAPLNILLWIVVTTNLAVLTIEPPPALCLLSAVSRRPWMGLSISTMAQDIGTPLGRDRCWVKSIPDPRVKWLPGDEHSMRSENDPPHPRVS